jgi:hypothetical protein
MNIEPANLKPNKQKPTNDSFGNVVELFIFLCKREGVVSSEY